MSNILSALYEPLYAKPEGQVSKSHRWDERVDWLQKTIMTYNEVYILFYEQWGNIFKLKNDIKFLF